MSAPVTTPTVTITTEALDSLIADSVELMTRRSEEAPTIVHGPVIAYGPVTTLATPQPAPTVTPDHLPAPFEPDRFWDGNVFWFTLLALKWGALLGIGTLLAAYIAWPVITLVATVVSFVTGPGALIGAAAFVVATAYWATSLLGFWDHKRPARSRAAAKPVAMPAPSHSVTPAPPARSRAAAKPVVKPARPVAHLVGQRGTACGTPVVEHARNARRNDLKCTACVVAARSVYVDDNGTLTYI